jgi:hypothetical protein
MAAFLCEYQTGLRKIFCAPSLQAVFNTVEEKFVEKPDVTRVTFCKVSVSTLCTASGAYCIASS